MLHGFYTHSDGALYAELYTIINYKLSILCIVLKFSDSTVLINIESNFTSSSIQTF